MPESDLNLRSGTLVPLFYTYAHFAGVWDWERKRHGMWDWRSKASEKALLENMTRQPVREKENIQRKMTVKKKTSCERYAVLEETMKQTEKREKRLMYLQTHTHTHKHHDDSCSYFKYHFQTHSYLTVCKVSISSCAAGLRAPPTHTSSYLRWSPLTHLAMGLRCALPNDELCIRRCHFEKCNYLSDKADGPVLSGICCASIKSLVLKKRTARTQTGGVWTDSRMHPWTYIHAHMHKYMRRHLKFSLCVLPVDATQRDDFQQISKTNTTLGSKSIVPVWCLDQWSCWKRVLLEGQAPIWHL